MKFILSGRITEKFGEQAAASLSFGQFIQLAARTGYDGVCMRASFASVDTPAETVRVMKRQLDVSGLKVSMVTGNYAIPHNDEHGPDALRHITPHLDLAKAFGASLVRICMKKKEDIFWAQKAADEARERGITLVHQCHPASLFETTDQILEVIGRVSRANFGIIYEATVLYMCGDPAPHQAVARLAPYIFNVYVQNCRVHPTGQMTIETWTRGNVRVDWLPLPELGGTNFPEVFKALRQAGYDGPVTVHQAFGGLLTPEVAARQSYEFLKPLVMR
jgi:sugar phosphate isomerase/epimerase